MPAPRMWAVMFFFMFLCLGLNSQFAIVEVVVTSIQDGFSSWIKRKLIYHELLVLIVCVVSFFFGLPNIIQVSPSFISYIYSLHVDCVSSRCGRQSNINYFDHRAEYTSSNSWIITLLHWLSYFWRFLKLLPYHGSLALDGYVRESNR